MEEIVAECYYGSPEASRTKHYIWQPLKQLVLAEGLRQRRVFEVGCGNGATAGMLSALGFDVTAIDASSFGIRHARAAYPHVAFAKVSAHDDLASDYGVFPVIISIEVVARVY